MATDHGNAITQRTRRKPKRAKQLGVTDEEYARLLAAQGGGCAICGNPPKNRRLDVDHDHRTGAVRGLLCHRCNRALPTWVTEEWLYAAARYLRQAQPCSCRRSSSPNAAAGVNPGCLRHGYRVMNGAA